MEIFPQGKRQDCLRAYLTPKPLTFRVNTLKTNCEFIEKQFQRLGVKLTRESLIQNCYYVDSDFSDKKFRSLSVYTEGLIYAQNLSSQLPPLILNPQPGENILDVCASPGSKTTQIAALMHNQGDITALEPDRIRFERLKHNITLLGAKVTPLNYHAERYINKHLGENLPLFDRALADVPCSGDGTFYVHDKSSFAHWSETEEMKRHKQQVKILRSALSVVKSGGLVLYSTCSISPEENEFVLDELLSEQPNFCLLDLKPKLPQQLYSAPLLSWRGKNVNNTISRACRILPSHKTEGFFLALLQKT